MYEKHHEIRLRDAKVVNEMYPDRLWECYDSRISTTGGDSTSWKVKTAEGKMFWAFVTDGKLHSTTLY